MSAPSTDAGWRRSNLGHLLFAATGRCVAIEREHVGRAGFPDMSEAQLALFRRLDPAGTRLTTLAARTGSTKQSTIELVDRAERRGLVARTSDPQDGRAKIVHLSAQGAALRRMIDEGTRAAQHHYAATVRDGTAVIGALADYTASTGAHGAITDILSSAGRRFVRDVLGAVHRHGHADVTEAMLALFRTLELEGSRLTEIAAVARITKQSMRGLVERAERLRLIERAPDLADGRAKLIRFSDAGLLMLEEMRRGVVRAEAGFASATDRTQLRRVKAGLEGFLAGGV